jgi:hypothetical protein
MRKTVFLVSMLLLMAGSINGQTKNHRFNILGSVAMPTGEFGDYTASIAGSAKLGFGLSAEYYRIISKEGLMWVSSISIFTNGVDVSIYEWLYEEYGGTADAQKWVNIPIMTGLGVKGKNYMNVELYGLLMIGINVVEGPDIEMGYPSSKTKITTGSGNSLGFSIGGGMILGSRINMGIRYLILGQPDINVTKSRKGLADEYSKAEQSISIVSFMAGMTF